MANYHQIYHTITCEDKEFKHNVAHHYNLVKLLLLYSKIKIAFWILSNFVHGKFVYNTPFHITDETV